MKKVFLYSAILLVGILFSQIIDVERQFPILGTLTAWLLAYIMIEVGLEFTIDKSKLSSYAKDCCVAMSAAMLPWFLCALYFRMVVGGVEWKEAFLVGCFAAPTSAGVLFAMLAAAGLGMTWLFQKARILAIFDDLGSIVLLIPLQLLFIGFRKEGVLLLLLIALLFYIAYRFLHRLRFPTHGGWLLFYGLCVALFCNFFERQFHIELEVLMPAFTLGCILIPRELQEDGSAAGEAQHPYLEPKSTCWHYVDTIAKGLFMLFVGASLPKMELGAVDLSTTIAHVVLLTVLSNLGKMVPALFYRQEVSLRERLALGVVMFPRGEVGAGILLISLGYGIGSYAVTLGALSLALNLLCTALFIWTALLLCGNVLERTPSKTHNGS